METQSHIHTQRHAHIHRCIHLHIHGHISCCHVHTCTHTRAHVISHPWIWVSAISSASVILHVLFWFHFIHPLSFIESVCSARATIWLHKALQKMLLFLLFLRDAVSTVSVLHYKVLSVACSGPGNTEHSAGKGQIVFINFCISNSQHNVRHVVDAPKMPT